ncbi:MAG: prohibitin family protein [Candidatus Magnetomorum sp.]|nr:prohibitin family protein [Candidatus Magnetomorum sp.]
MIILFFIVYLSDRIIVSVRSGEGGVLYRLFFGGTVVDKVYGEGIHFIWPFDRMYVYNCRVQHVAHRFFVLTKNGLNVQMDISIRYYPEYDLLAVLHKKLGQDYVNVVVIPEIESVFRKVIGQRNAEGIYTTEKAFLETSLNDAIERLERKYIIIDDVIIKRIKLPDAVDKTIQKKLEEKHLADAYKYILQKEKKEIERKDLEATGLKKLSKALDNKILQWMSIKASLELAKSQNSKVIVIGGGKNGLPIIGNIPFDANEVMDMEAADNHSSLTIETMNQKKSKQAIKE